MKRVSMILGMVLVSILLLFGFGCNDDSGGDSSPAALTEHDFADDSELSADLQDTVVMFLESPTAEEQLSDTHEMGVDIISYYITETATHSFCWEDDNAEAQHYMILHDDEGNEVLGVYSNGACVTATLEAGHYTMYLYHDGDSSDTQTVFIRPNEGDGDAEELSTAKTGKYVTWEPDTLIRTNKCVHCDLRDTDLSNAKLSGADLHSARLHGTNLSGADLRKANLSYADLSHADLSWADLSQAKLSGAKLSGANLYGADLTWANLSHANLSHADLRDTDLSGTNLSGADLREANLEEAELIDTNLSGADLREANPCDALLFVSVDTSGATWTDGSTCNWHSDCDCW